MVLQGCARSRRVSLLPNAATIVWGHFGGTSFHAWGHWMLTDAAIKKAKPKDKAYKLGDSGGLYLYIMPSGYRSWP